MTQAQQTPSEESGSERLPLAGLIALGTAGFITIMTEALPAGVLPAMSSDLGVTESAAGQTVTVYALGSALAAVPLTALTIGWPRRRLLLIAVGGFCFANTVTAFSPSYVLTMGARLVAGVVAGLLWALLAGYARRMVTPQLRGKAMAIAMAGTPVALSIGVPAGTYLANLVGWRYTFGIMTLLTAVLIVAIIATVPRFPGTTRSDRLPVNRALRIPGVAPVLVVTLTFVFAHNILYTYVAPFLAPIGLAERVDSVLLVFGVMSLVSIWLTGAFIEGHLRSMMILSCALFALAGGAFGVFGVFGGQTWSVYFAAGVWGLAFGGAATLLQTASAEAAGQAGDVAQSLVVTCWNIGIAGGGVAGGVLLSAGGPGALPWAVLALVLPALIVTACARRHGFPTAARQRQ